MKVTLVKCDENAEDYIVKIARVSSKRTDKTAKPEGLIRYLVKNNHWSPFEHAHMTLEIETSRAIGAQLLRHRSFTFQEFSQRYQDVELLSDGDVPFEHVELRKQCENNRQSSTDLCELTEELKSRVENVKNETWKLYKDLLNYGVSRECARFILPLSVKTKIHMTGSVRSWIHFLGLRDDGHAQKEIRDLAIQIRKIFNQQFPNVASSL